MYHASLTQPLLRVPFAMRGGAADEPLPSAEEGGGQFISAVCWRDEPASQPPAQRTLLAANSEGLLRVFALD